MDTGLKHHAKRSINTLYHWLFRDPAHDPSPSESTALHKAASVASSASSAFSSAVTSLAGDGNSQRKHSLFSSLRSGGGSSTLPLHRHATLDRFLSFHFPSLEFWRQFTPLRIWSSSFDHFDELLSCLRDLSSHLGVYRVAEQYDVAPHYVILAILLMVVVLVYFTVVCIRSLPAYSSDHLADKGSNIEEEPWNADNNQGLPTSYQSDPQHNDNPKLDLSKDVTADEDSQSHVLDPRLPRLQRHGTIRHGGDIMAIIMEDVIGPTEAQREEEEIDLDNYEEYEANAPDDDTSGHTITNLHDVLGLEKRTSQDTLYNVKNASNVARGVDCDHYLSDVSHQSCDLVSQSIEEQDSSAGALAPIPLDPLAMNVNGKFPKFVAQKEGRTRDNSSANQDENLHTKPEIARNNSRRYQRNINVPTAESILIASASICTSSSSENHSIEDITCGPIHPEMWTEESTRTVVDCKTEGDPKLEGSLSILPVPPDERQHEVKDITLEPKLVHTLYKDPTEGSNTSTTENGSKGEHELSNSGNGDLTPAHHLETDGVEVRKYADQHAAEGAAFITLDSVPSEDDPSFTSIREPYIEGEAEPNYQAISTPGMAHSPPRTMGPMVSEAVTKIEAAERSAQHEAGSKVVVTDVSRAVETGRVVEDSAEPDASVYSSLEPSSEKEDSIAVLLGPAKNDAPRSNLGHYPRHRNVTLDHNEYVFRDNYGNIVAPEDLDDIYDSEIDDQGEESSDSGLKNSRKGILSSAPGVFHTARAAAAAVAARMADISHENMDIAKNTLSGLLGNVGESLMGSSEAKKDQILGKAEGRERHELEEEPSTPSMLSNAQTKDKDTQTITTRERSETGGIPEHNGTDENDGGGTDNDNESVAPIMEATLASPFKTNPSQLHTYKPSHRNQRIDHEGFIAIEDCRRTHKSYNALQQTHMDALERKDMGHPNISSSPATSLEPAMTYDGATQPGQQGQKSTDACHVNQNTPNPSRSLSGKVVHSAPNLTDLRLSYSGATKSGLTEGDHGVRTGITEHVSDVSSIDNSREHEERNNLIVLDTKKTEDEPFSRPTDGIDESSSLDQRGISSRDRPCCNYFLDQIIHPEKVNNTTRRHSLPLATSTTTVCLEHCHGLVQGVGVGTSRLIQQKHLWNHLQKRNATKYSTGHPDHNGAATSLTESQ
ncbi:hypothetical protein B0O80DRAFT_513833 [Mortierella sp. GBAus27b]|nr:hypothetical protein B0O80DRAFT_513833 [Mortierella sp. GBAus27b]